MLVLPGFNVHVRSGGAAMGRRAIRRAPHLGEAAAQGECNGRATVVPALEEAAHGEEVVGNEDLRLYEVHYVVVRVPEGGREGSGSASEKRRFVTPDRIRRREVGATEIYGIEERRR